MRAAQAFNRTAGVGEYEPVGGPQLRLAASLESKNIDKQTQAGILQAKQMGDLLKERLDKEYGVKVKGADGQESYAVAPEIQRLTLGERPQNAADVEAIMQRIRPEAEKFKAISTYNDLKNADTLGLRNRAAGLYPNDAKMQEYIKTAPITDTNLGWFQDHFSRIPQPAGPPTTQNLRAAADETGIIPGTLDRATLLGKTLSYELQPSLRMSGVPAPTLDSVRAGRIAERNRIWDEEGKSQPASLRTAAPPVM